VTVDVSAVSTAGFDEATIKAFRRVRGHVERDASYFTSPDLKTGQWIFFDVNMGYGTVHRDTGVLPPEDDVALFYGSYRASEADGQVFTDLLLCGSTEHQLRRTASAGRMGSGTEWLHDLIGTVNDADRDGNGARSWQPQLSPTDRARVYVPHHGAGKGSLWQYEIGVSRRAG
jgi:hypothetical protein